MFTKFVYTILAFIKLKRIKPQPKEIILICSSGLGDTYFVCALAKAIAEKHKLKISVLIKENHQVIATAFKQHLHRIIIFDNKIIKHTKLFSRKLKGQGFFYAHIGLIFYPQKIKFETKTILDLYKLLFSLDKNTKLLKPKYPINKGGSKQKKKILIAPESISTQSLSPKFWQALIKEIEKMGYEIVINSNKKEYFYKNYNQVISLENLIYNINDYATIIAIRSGLCDLLAETKIKKIVVYNNHPWYDTNVFNANSFSRMRLGKNIEEIIFKDNNNNTISEIINKI